MTKTRCAIYWLIYAANDIQTGSTGARKEKDKLCIMPKYVFKGIDIQTGKYDRELRRRHSVQSILTYSAQGVNDTGNVTASEGKTRYVFSKNLCIQKSMTTSE